MEEQNRLSADIDYLRALADAGRKAPLRVGPYLIAAGSWFGLASLILALAQLGVIAVPNAAVMWVFIGSTLGFGATLAVLIRRDRQQGEREQQRLIGAIWSGAGLSIFVFWCAVTLLAFRLDDGAVLNTISLVVLCLYGLVWWITGVVAEANWMKGVAAVSFAAVFMVSWFASTEFGWLTYALSLIGCMLLPGLYIQRISRAEA